MVECIVMTTRLFLPGSIGVPQFSAKAPSATGTAFLVDNPECVVAIVNAPELPTTQVCDTPVKKENLLSVLFNRGYRPINYGAF